MNGQEPDGTDCDALSNSIDKLVEELSREMETPAICGQAGVAKQTKGRRAQRPRPEEMAGLTRKGIHLSFRFHPVGQGLFYAGRLGDFRLVYDCGTDSGHQYIESALSVYDSPGKLDLLILSHFHDDHINGVQKLLLKTKGVREVILPYLHPTQRLMAAAGYAIKNDLEALTPEYVDFLRDPVAYLIERRAERITFIAPGNPVDEWPNYPGGMVDGANWYGGELDKVDFSGLEATQPEVRIRPHSAIFRAVMWQFKFYCQPNRTSPDDIRRELRARGIAPDDLVDALSKRLDDLKDIYHSLFDGSAGQNATSLMCCHGPVARIQFDSAWVTPYPIHWYNCGPIPCRCNYYFGIPIQFTYMPSTVNPAFDQMLTGDANVKLDDYRRHFSHELAKVHLFCLPHHGSEENWRSDFLTDHTHCQLWICSAGLGNRHRHPHKRVVYDLHVARKLVCVCHELQGLTIDAEGVVL